MHRRCRRRRGGGRCSRLMPALHLSKWLARWISHALSLTAVCVAISTAEAREPYPLCGIDAERFKEFAFPNNGTMYVERLTKWPMAPNLIVLSNRPSLKSDVDLAFAEIAREQVFRDAQLVFVPYKEPDEITLAARNY